MTRARYQFWRLVWQLTNDFDHPLSARVERRYLESEIVYRGWL